MEACAMIVWFMVGTHEPAYKIFPPYMTTMSEVNRIWPLPNNRVPAKLLGIDREGDIEAYAVIKPCPDIDLKVAPSQGAEIIEIPLPLKPAPRIVVEPR